MKISIEIDCTPVEARALLGLPDLQPLGEEFVAALRARMAEGLGAAPEQALRAWLAAAAPGVEAARTAFWSAPAKAGADKGKGKGAADPGAGQGRESDGEPDT